MLSEAFGHETGLVLVDAAVGVFFDLENPLAPDDVLSRRLRDERPGAVLLQSGELKLHGLTP